MYSRNCIECIFKVCKNNHVKYSTNGKSLKLDRVLLLQKMSRLEMERYCQPKLSPKELEKNIKKRGIDYNSMLKHHSIHKEFQAKVEKSFADIGISTKAVTRFDYTDSNIESCDAVFPIGGDGTFLLAASRVLDRHKPVIGFNSDPCRSEGHLCLPKKYSSDIKSALEKLKQGKFRWMYRTRIRVEFKGEKKHQFPVELHEEALKLKFTDIREESNRVHGNDPGSSTNRFTANKFLALNEVFVGEIVSAKVSYFEMRLNNNKLGAKVKSSGLCVCTGTGSTSWNMSINRLTSQDVQQLLEIYTKQSGGNISKNLVKSVADSYNETFKFDPENRKLCYTIRDLISVGVWPKPKGVIEPRGYAQTIEVKSKCSDAGLVIDGGISFPFNDGTVTHLTTYSEDALKTVVLDE